MANISKSFNFRNGVNVDDDNLVVNRLGLVGIGTTVPTEALDIRGNTNVSGILSAYTGFVTDLTVTGKLVAPGGINLSGAIGFGVSVGNPTGIVTAADTSGIVTYYGDGQHLINLPTSQWLDIDVGLGFTSVYSRGFVGITTVDPRFALQVGGTNGTPDTLQNGVGINSTGGIVATGIVTAQGGVTADVTGNIVAAASTLGVANASSINATGIVTASNFVGNVTGNVTGNVVGNIVGNVYATGISTFGDLRVTSGDITIAAGVVTATEFNGNLDGDVTGQINNVEAGTASTITNLNSTNIDATGGITTTTTLNSSYSTLGVSTVTSFRGTTIGLGINPGSKVIDSYKVGVSTVEFYGSDLSQIVVGNQYSPTSGIGVSLGIIRYGSTARTLDLINTDWGGFNYYLHTSASQVGAGDTGGYKWYYGGNTNLMTLTYDGKLGVGKTSPEFDLDVTGITSISQDLYVGGDLDVTGQIVGNLNIGTINGNLFNTTGVSTFNNIDVRNFAEIASIGIGTNSALPNIGLDARTETGLFETVGVGTDATAVALHVFGSSTTDNLGIGSLPGTHGLYVYDTDTKYEKSQIGITTSSITISGETLIYLDGSASVGIGTSVTRCNVDFADAGAATPTGRYMLPPRVTGAQRVGLVTQTGAFIYNTDTNTLQIYNGSTWLSQATGGAQSLDGLTDVSLSTPQSGQILGFNGSNWTDIDNTLNAASDVTITSPVAGDDLSYNGSAWVNDNTVSLTTTATSQTNLHTLAVATYRSVEYLVQGTQGSNYSLVKILAVHDGTNVSFTEFGTLTTGSAVGAYTMDVSGGLMRLRVTPASASSSTFKVKYTTIKV